MCVPHHCFYGIKCIFIIKKRCPPFYIHIYYKNLSVPPHSDMARPFGIDCWDLLYLSMAGAGAGAWCEPIRCYNKPVAKFFPQKSCQSIAKECPASQAYPNLSQPPLALPLPDDSFATASPFGLPRRPGRWPIALRPPGGPRPLLYRTFQGYSGHCSATLSIGLL